MNDKQETVEEFIARKGKVRVVDPTVQSDKHRHPSLKICKCGCEGNYTDHMMRRGERGIY